MYNHNTILDKQPQYTKRILRFLIRYGILPLSTKQTRRRRKGENPMTLEEQKSLIEELILSAPADKAMLIFAVLAKVLEASAEPSQPDPGKSGR